jgi:hypothetical protein
MPNMESSATKDRLPVAWLLITCCAIAIMAVYFSGLAWLGVKYPTSRSWWSTHHILSPRSLKQPCVFAFEDDSRETCLVHKLPLTEVLVPVWVNMCVEPPSSRLFKGAPHGRLAADGGSQVVLAARISRCEACVLITERNLGDTRFDVEKRWERERDLPEGILRAFAAQRSDLAFKAPRPTMQHSPPAPSQ